MVTRKLQKKDSKVLILFWTAQHLSEGWLFINTEQKRAKEKQIQWSCSNLWMYQKELKKSSNYMLKTKRLGEMYCLICFKGPACLAGEAGDQESVGLCSVLDWLTSHCEESVLLPALVSSHAKLQWGWNETMDTECTARCGHLVKMQCDGSWDYLLMPLSTHEQTFKLRADFRVW